MANLHKIACEGYDEYYLNLEMVTSIGTTTVSGGPTNPVKAVVVNLAGGTKIAFPAEFLTELVNALDKTRPPKDRDIPDVYFRAWKDWDKDLRA